MSYRLLPEWHPQCAVMLTWPHPQSDWTDVMTEVEAVYMQLVSAISRHEKVLLICHDEAHRQHVSNCLDGHADLANIVFADISSNDTWVRDYGPISVADTDNNLLLLDFVFNGWGKKFDASLDNTVTRRLHQTGVFADTPLVSMDLVLEGGSIDFNGRDTLLTTTQCLLSPMRNPQLSKAEINQILQTRFGVNNIVWLTHGHLEGDDTDAHIDTLARFVDSRTIAHCICEDPHDSHYTGLQAMTAELATLVTEDGEPFRLVPLPLPRPIYFEGRRLSATYANFLIINDAILVPVYDDPADDTALTRLRAVAGNREVIGIDCRALIKQNGSLHCITMQLPMGVLGRA